MTRWSSERNGFADTDHLYIRDTESGRVWTPTPLPVHRLPEQYQVRFTEDQAFGLHLDTDLTVVVQHQVSPEADAVVRKMTITNDGARTRHLDAVSYQELVLAQRADARAHPVFSKMFVHTEVCWTRAACWSPPGAVAHRVTRRSGRPTSSPRTVVTSTCPTSPLRN